MTRYIAGLFCRTLDSMCISRVPTEIVIVGINFYRFKDQFDCRQSHLGTIGKVLRAKFWKQSNREEKCDVTVSPWLQNFWITTIGNLSDDNEDDGDGNKNGEKTISLDSKTTTLHVYTTLFCTFLSRRSTAMTWNFLISRVRFIN